MAVKTFTTEVLTSADTNTYLANSGLVYVSSTTVGTGVSTVTVSNAFSSTYDNYHIIYSGGLGSTNANVALSLGSTSTGYYGSLFGSTYAAGTPVGIGINNGNFWLYLGFINTSYALMSIDLFHPNLARVTNISSNWSFNFASTGYSMFAGEQASSTQFTSFIMAPSSGTITGGAITVYGYRKA